MKSYTYSMVKYLILILFVSCFSIFVEAGTVPVVEITPSRFELLVEPRGKNVQAIKISNLGIDPLTLIATTSDWDMGEGGGLLLKDPGTLPQSASNWIRFNPKKFVIDPGKTQFLRFSVSVPPNIKPGEYRTSLVLVTEEKYAMQEGFFFKPTFAILVYVNIPEVKRCGEIKNVSVTVSEEDVYFLKGQILSTGNAHMRLTGEYFLYNDEGKELKNEQIGKKLILPGRTDSFEINLGKELEAGDYKLKLIWYYLPAFYMEGKLDEYPLNQEGLIKEFSFSI